MAIIEIPDFPFSSHFYPELLEDLILFMRANVPELTDEDPTEPHIQLLRAFALSSHLNNVLLDIVANEMFLPTAKLRSSHRDLLALIDVKLKQASPASVDMLVQLTQVLTATTTTIPVSSSFATLETRAAPAVEYEALAAVTSIRTDLVEKVIAQNSTGGLFADHTAAAQSPSGSAFTPGWGAAAAGDFLYIGHQDVLFDKIRFNILTAMASGSLVAVWEYFDGNFDQANPTSVTKPNGFLRFNVNSILGTSDRTGAIVRVRSNTTGAFLDLISTFTAGENRIETVAGPDAFLGQTTPSTVATDYIVGSEWRELDNVVDGTANFFNVGSQDVDFNLPQTITENWRKTKVDPGGSLEAEAYWVRFRIISQSGSPTLPSIEEVTVDDGKQFQVFPVTQGRTREDDPLGSSDATAAQEFVLSNFPVIDDNNLKIFVTEGTLELEYVKVDNFLNSVGTDRHFTLDFDDDGIATIKFGDGTNGKIPPAGVNNIRAEYRTADELDGNVGANTITVNRSGIAFITNITNPRAAAGFSAKEGDTDADLVRLKVSGPATLRIRDRAVSTEDVEQLSLTFKAADGSSPVKRALAIEEAFGPKTVEVVVVGAGGAQVVSSKLQEIEDFFNGTLTTPGKIVMNHEATATNFSQKSIDVTATVEGGNLSAILTALTGLLNPLAVKSDGTFQWAFGTEVPLSKLTQGIMNTDPPPRKSVITVPAADVGLGTRELPIVGTLSITVIP